MKHQIHLGTRKLYAEHFGRGQPTVVIEVGSNQAGTKDQGWWPLRDALAQKTSVVMYDRAGLGDSDPVSLPRLISEFTADLHAVLAAVPIEKPYLLVGGSFGGLIVTHYASLYPEAIVGIVLVDSTHPEHNQRTLALLPSPLPGEGRALGNFRNLLWQETYVPLSTKEEEGLDFLTSVSQMRASWALGDIPLTVLTAGQDEWEDGFPPEVASRYEQLWLALQRELAGRSTQSTHLIVNESGHCIHVEQPQVVLDAIHGMLRRA
jgi:pimeloyl-ACP methyl ester carboxylesterase